LIYLILVMIYLFTSFMSAIFSVPYVGTQKKLLDHIFKPVHIRSKDIFYDLGSGDGRIVFYIKKTHDAQTYGVEFNPFLYVFSQIINKGLYHSKAHFIYSKVQVVDLSHANIIYVFLLPKLLKLLAPKIMAECKRGTVVVSHGFKIESFEKLLYKEAKGKQFNTYYYRL